MKLSKNVLQLFFKAYPNEVLLLAFVVDGEEIVGDMSLGEDGELISSKEVTKEYLDQMKDGEFVEIYLEKSQERKVQNLLGEGKDLLPPINSILSPQDALKFIEICKNMNELARKKREARLARDILLGFFSLGIAELAGSCGDPLTKQMARSISKKNKEENKNISIPITLNEKGFLIFTEQKNADSEGMSVLTEAIENIREKTEEKMPVQVVFSRKMFLEHYEKMRPEVVVLVCHEECVEGMLLYIYLKTVDPFAKLLAIGREDWDGEKEDFVEKLEMAYNLNYSDIAESVQKSKKRLDPDTEYEIKQELRELKKDYQKINYVKIAYRIQLLSVDYDVQYLLRMVKTMVKNSR